MTTTLQRPTPARQVGVAVLLVYGLKIPVPRPGHPGFRLTVQIDGAVHVEPVGFGSRLAAGPALLELHTECHQLGLEVAPLPLGFVVRRRHPAP